MPETRAVDIIGVPLDYGITELGLRLGPDAFREAKLADICRYYGIDVRDLGNLKVLPRELDSTHDQVQAICECCNNLAERVSGSIKSGRLPVCLGGDHSLAIGSIAGAASCVDDVGCVWIDAHPDANTPETSPTGNIHGMPVAVILGHGPESLVNVGFRGATLNYDALSILGAQDIDEQEAAFLASKNVPIYSAFNIVDLGLPNIMNEIIERLGKRRRGVHVSLDLDVIMESLAPGVGMSSRIGFDMREVLYVCRRLAEECEIVAIDVVGLNPVRDSNMKTAYRAIEIIMCLLGHPFNMDYYHYLLEQK